MNRIERTVIPNDSLSYSSNIRSISDNLGKLNRRIQKGEFFLNNEIKSDSNVNIAGQSPSPPRRSRNRNIVNYNMNTVQKKSAKDFNDGNNFNVSNSITLVDWMELETVFNAILYDCPTNIREKVLLEIDAEKNVQKERNEKVIQKVTMWNLRVIVLPYYNFFIYFDHFIFKRLEIINQLYLVNGESNLTLQGSM